jgi:DNA-binding response OmpR family regulator
MLLGSLWIIDTDNTRFLHVIADTKTLDVHVKRLRSKIEADPANPIRLITVRGLGYKLEG